MKRKFVELEANKENYFQVNRSDPVVKENTLPVIVSTQDLKPSHIFEKLHFLRSPFEESQQEPKKDSQASMLLATIQSKISNLSLHISEELEELDIDQSSSVLNNDFIYRSPKPIQIKNQVLDVTPDKETTLNQVNGNGIIDPSEKKGQNNEEEEKQEQEQEVISNNKKRGPQKKNRTGNRYVRKESPSDHKWSDQEVEILRDFLADYPASKFKPENMRQIVRELNAEFAHAGLQTVIKPRDLANRFEEDLKKANKKIEHKNETYKHYNSYIHLNIDPNYD